MDYKASLDSSAKIITVLVVIFFVILITHLLRTAMLSYKARQHGIPLLYLFISFTMIALIISAYGLNVSKYQIIDSNLVIVTPFHKKVINKTDILTMTIMDQGQLAGYQQHCGNHNKWEHRQR